MRWQLRFLGVGSAAAVELGSPMAVIERDGAPWLTIDCGGEGLTAYRATYGAMPDALFITHVHLDHVAGFERLFVDAFFNPARRGRIRLYVPATVVPLLHRRVAEGAGRARAQALRPDGAQRHQRERRQRGEGEEQAIGHGCSYRQRRPQGPADLDAGGAGP